MIDQQKVWTCVYELKRTTPNDVIAELNFYFEKKKGKKQAIDSVDRAIPRVEAFDPVVTILQAKRQLMRKYQHIYEEELGFDVDEENDQNDKRINDAIHIFVRDNLPVVRKKNGMQTKAECEFCGSKHSAQDEFCDLKFDDVDGNSLQAAKSFTIKQIVDKMVHTRPLVLVVVLKDVYKP